MIVLGDWGDWVKERVFFGSRIDRAAAKARSRGRRPIFVIYHQRVIMNEYLPGYLRSGTWRNPVWIVDHLQMQWIPNDNFLLDGDGAGFHAQVRQFGYQPYYINSTQIQREVSPYILLYIPSQTSFNSHDRRCRDRTEPETIVHRLYPSCWHYR